MNKEETLRNEDSLVIESIHVSGVINDTFLELAVICSLINEGEGRSILGETLQDQVFLFLKFLDGVCNRLLQISEFISSKCLVKMRIAYELVVTEGQTAGVAEIRNDNVNKNSLFTGTAGSVTPFVQTIICFNNSDFDMCVGSFFQIV